METAVKANLGRRKGDKTRSNPSSNDVSDLRPENLHNISVMEMKSKWESFAIVRSDKHARLGHKGSIMSCKRPRRENMDGTFFLFLVAVRTRGTVALLKLTRSYLSLLCDAIIIMLYMQAKD